MKPRWGSLAVAEKGLEAQGPSRYHGCRGRGCLVEDTVLGCGCTLASLENFEMKQNWTVPTQGQILLVVSFISEL